MAEIGVEPEESLYTDPEAAREDKEHAREEVVRLQSGPPPFSFSVPLSGCSILLPRCT